MENEKDKQVEEKEDTRLDFLTVQYVQMHESKRAWERYIWQTPLVIGAIVGITFSLLSTLLGETRLIPPLVLAAILLIFSMFTAVMFYWAFRSRILLRITEDKLIEIDNEYGRGDLSMYPRLMNRGLPLYKRLSSTLLNLIFLAVLASALLALSIILFVSQLSG